jgi:cytochrome b pre-mRNA-processing protein 3
VLGTNSKTSTAIRETRTPYKRCAEREEIEEKFLYKGALSSFRSFPTSTQIAPPITLKDCHLPTTYQTWFQVTNLHVWLLTVRYRALPPPHGKSFVQELINHFFLNVEDRMREVLGKKVSERIIRGYMKEMRDQWAGSTASYDLAMVSSDADFAAAIWRNIFAARGEKGSNVAAEPSADSNAPTRAKDDELQLAELPYQLYLFTAYVRKETKRLERIKDEDVMGGKIGDFGRIGEGVGDWIDEAAEEDLKAKDRAGRTVQSQQKAAKRRAA